MLQVIIEILPGNFQGGKKEIGRIEVVNEHMDSNEIGNFIAHMADGDKVKHNVKIKGYNRKQDIWCLVKRILDEMGY